MHPRRSTVYLQRKREFGLLVRLLTQTLKITSIVAMTLLVIAGSVAFFDFWTDREQSDGIGRPVTITIMEEDDGAAVADKLADADLISYGFYFETRFRFSGDELQPGTYVLRRGMSVAEIIDAVSVPGEDEPDATTEAPAEAVQVTFIEGQRIEQNAQVLVDAGWQGDPQEYIDLAKTPSNPDAWSFMENAPDGASYEGFLFPAQYTIPANVSAQDIINLQLDQFDQQYSSDMRATTEERDTTIYDVVTLGSIVEREAAVEGERVTIAGLYLNRLEQGIPLQADPTIQYALGTADDWWPADPTQDQIDSVFDNPYNTYNQDITPGLPPGPISNPGIRAIQSVLSPEEHDFIYMYAPQGSDTHLFTSSLEEHTQNICNDDPDAPVCGGGSRDNEEPGDLDLAWIAPNRRFVAAA